MRVLMLGWEFPPYISGGLGTACQGLTRAMTGMGVPILFVLPTAASPEQRGVVASEDAAAIGGAVRFVKVPCQVRNPYGGLSYSTGRPVGETSPAEAEDAGAVLEIVGTGACGGYEGNLILRIAEYADRCVQMTLKAPFDVIHAHDWVTFPAGLAIAKRSGRPLVVHVHSTEFDRSGDSVNQAICDIEQEGVNEADKVIAVSNLTKGLVVNRYGVSQQKVDVVHNGISPKPRSKVSCQTRGDKVVLFLGRLTMQKGPEFFLRAAQRVLEKLPNVRFVIAGWGDLGPRVIEQVVNMGLGRRVQFTGFVRGAEVERTYGLADVYVMPSVSEPFGLTALEAIQQGVPAVISRSSGVAEVLTHGALKCDFWDVDGMADRILAVLRHPELAAALRASGTREIQALTWDCAARKCVRVYWDLLGDSPDEPARPARGQAVA